MFDHKDKLDVFNDHLGLSHKLAYLHGLLKQRFEFIERIAVALYDPRTDLLRTFIDSSGGDRPLNHYDAKLSDARSLSEIVSRGQPRVVNDLGIFAAGNHEHTRRIRAQGYSASYTLPIYLNGEFIGFVFFNSFAKDVFDEEVLHYLDLFGHLISLAVIKDRTAVRTLAASVHTAIDIVHHRDFETGYHIDRVANYARLIAKGLADRKGLSDEEIEYIFLFAPLHDIGKIGIPDRILLKPGRLDTAEWEIMKSHTRKGREIIDAMLDNFGLERLKYIDVLRNIAYCHHEAFNGEGYPNGLKGEEIPIEARIVSVVDVFDALTSARSYKKAWSNDDAFQLLCKAAGVRFDPECVDTLVNSREAVEHIQACFEEKAFA